MPDSSAAFVGSIPANYDRHLGPLLFHQYADDLVERLVVRPGIHACSRRRAAIEHNEVARIADETVTAFFPDDPPRFYAVPYGFYDRNLIRSLLIDAGFERVDLDVVDKVGVSPSAADAATGYIEGNSMLNEILNRRPEALAEIKATLAHNIATRLGDHPVRSPLRAIVVTAHRPV